MSKMGMKERADILIVDDTPANLRLLSQMLVKEGFEVRAVTSGARALESIRAGKPNLILLDIKMPEMDGYQVCEQLKSEANTCDIPVIFISALDDLQDKIKAFSVGGVDYITKPFQVEEVLARTRTHLSLQKLNRQLAEANQKFAWELELAGRMQASFLPEEPPEIPGWQVSVKLKPAREMSGDFFDIFALPNGKWGILVADVVDKGVGAALLMVLSWSLLRTYAREYPHEPDKVFDMVNRRILADTDGDQFVSVFYGVLDPRSGDLVYGNAGHCLPIWEHEDEAGNVMDLTKTGTVLGIFGEESWFASSVHLHPGDVLVLYTDGVTEAQNPDGVFFERERLRKSVQASNAHSAVQICDDILTALETHIDGAEQFDDIALVVIKRVDEAGKDS